MIKNFIKSLSEKVYKHLEKNSGSMILITGITGIVLSMLAQTGAIITNKKYSFAEKAFMVPQEMAEGLITALSMFVITKPFQKLCSTYVQKGKLLTKEMKNYMRKNNILDKRGELNFNLKSFVENKIDEIKRSDIYRKSTQKTKESILREHTDMLNTYNSVYDSASAMSTTIGGIISTAFIAPMLRNYAASSVQKKKLESLKNKPDYTYTNQYSHAQNLKI